MRRILTVVLGLILVGALVLTLFDPANRLTAPTQVLALVGVATLALMWGAKAAQKQATQSASVTGRRA